MTTVSFSREQAPARSNSFSSWICANYMYVCIFYIYSYAAIFLTDYGVRASYFYYLTWAVGGMALFLSAGKKWKELPRLHLSALAGFLGLLLVQGIVSAGSVITNFSYIAKVYFIFTTLGFFFILNLTEDWPKLRTAITIVVLFSCAVNFIELFHASLLPHRLSTTAGRAAGLYRNSNQSAFFIGVAAPLICVGIWRWAGVALLGATMIGVLLTFSRSGLLCWIVAAGFTLAMMRKKALARDQVAAAVLGMILFAFLFWIFHQPILEFVADVFGPILNQDTTNRLRGQLNDASAQQRLYLQQFGWKIFLTAPIFGKGIGYTFLWDLSVSTHNIYLLFLVEAGLVGACWLAFFFLSLLDFPGGYGPALLCILLVLGVFTHAIFDEPSYGLVMALYWRASKDVALNPGGHFPAPARAAQVVAL